MVQVAAALRYRVWVWLTGAVLASLSASALPVFGRKEGKLTVLTEADFDTECCSAIRLVCHADHHFKSCFQRFHSSNMDDCSNTEIVGTCPFCFDKNLEENQDLDAGKVDSAAKSAKLAKAAAVCQEVAGPDVPTVSPGMEETWISASDGERALALEHRARIQPESSIEARRCPMGALQTQKSVCQLMPAAGACQKSGPAACQKSIDMQLTFHVDPTQLPVLVSDVVEDHAGLKRCLCDSIWSTCADRPFNNAGGSFDNTMPSTGRGLGVQPSPDECPVRVFILELEVLAAGIMADDKLQQRKSNYHAAIRAWQELWNNELQLNTNDHVTPVFDAVLRASQHGCIVDDSKLADVIYVPWLSSWQPQEGELPMATSSEMAAWVAQWTKAHMTDDQVFFFQTDTGSPSLHLDFEHKVDKLARGITKRVFYSVREPAHHEGCVGQKCPGLINSRDEYGGREPWCGSITNTDKNMDGMLSFRQVVLPYVVNAGLSSLVFSSGGSQFLLKKARPIDIFFMGTLDRFNCGHRVRRTIRMACDEYAALSQGEVACNRSSADLPFDQGMVDSKFCFAPRGDSPSSSQIYNAMAGGCIPIIVSDDFVLPFGAQFPWARVSIRVRERDFLDGRRRVHVMEELATMCRNGTYDRMRSDLIQHAPSMMYGYGRPALGLAPNATVKCRTPKFQFAPANDGGFIAARMSDHKAVCSTPFKTSDGFAGLFWKALAAKVLLWRSLPVVTDPKLLDSSPGLVRATPFEQPQKIVS
jgi:hypothetical protein